MVPDSSTSAWRHHLTPHRTLIIVAVAYMTATLPFAVRARLLLWDEVVYASQFAVGTIPARMTAPRAWGMPLLLAPADVLTSSVQAIRLYLTALSGLGMYLAFRPWLRVVEPWVVPVAAGLFTTLWTTVLYGSMAYPNLMLAFAGVAGLGYACRALVGPSDRWALAALATAFAVASMLRPTDASFLAAPLLAVCAARRAWRPMFGVSLGLAVGWIAWTGEAFIRFGGPIARLRLSSQVTDVILGFHPIPIIQALDGPNLQCRPTALCGDLHALEVIWWFALPVLVVAGIMAVRDRLPYLLAASSATLLALSYLVTLDWSNPRYLIPTYALLALPVASALVAGTRRHRVVAVVISIALLLHVAGQVMTYRRVADHELRLQTVLLRQDMILEGSLRVASPCVVFGPGSVELSFISHCRPVLDTSVPSLTDDRVQAALASGEQVVVIERSPLGGPPSVSGWRQARLGPTGGTWAYVADPPLGRP